MKLRQDVCMEGACKSVQLHNIGLMCLRALPYSNLSGARQVTIVTDRFTTNYNSSEQLKILVFLLIDFV